MTKTLCALIVRSGSSQERLALADCKVHRGDHVVLYSTTDDPSVLLWDSRARLREYHAASFDEAQAMLPHAFLVAPGTRANVISCVPDVRRVADLRSARRRDRHDDLQRSAARSYALGLGSDVRPLRPSHH